MMDNLRWHKSSFSGQDGNCVEVAIHEAGISVRDTKDQATGPVLTFTPDEWRAFLNGVRAAEFDLDSEA